MLENILYALSELTLLTGILILLCGALFRTSSQRFYFSVSKTVVLISALFAIIFYNKNFLSPYFISSAETALVFVLSAGLVVVWLFLSAKWFNSHKELNPVWLCCLALCLLLCFSLIIQTTNFGILFILIAALTCMQYLLFILSRNSEELYHTGRRYLLISLLFLILCGSALFYIKDHSLQYDAVAEYLTQIPDTFRIFVLTALLCLLLYLLGIAPFHFWIADRILPLIMPVATYFALIPTLFLWFLFFKINQNVLFNFTEPLQKIYYIFGILSALFGIIIANSSHFIKKTFASISLFQFGIVLLVFSTFRQNVATPCFLYIELYTFVLLGIYICLHAVKINGEYPVTLHSLRGLNSVHPFVAAVLMFLITVLIGLPPCSFFLTQFMMLMHIVKIPWIIYVVLLGSVMFVPVYLKIIQSIFLLPREQNFDRTDFSLYAGLLMYLIILIILSIKPQYFLIQELILSNG